MSESAKSRFAEALTRLLDETGLFSRAEWATFLSVSEPAISQWVHDKTLPRPETLRMILGVLSESDGVPEAPLRAFHETASAPASEVTPLALRGGRTIADYLVQPVLDGFMRTLKTLPGSAQEVVLRTAAVLCRDFVKQPELARSVATDLPAFLSELTALPTDDQEQVLTAASELCRLRGDELTQRCIRTESLDIVDTGKVERVMSLDVLEGAESVLELGRIFSPESHGTRHDPRSTTCLVGVWRIAPGRPADYPGLQVDEMAVLLLDGAAEFCFAGGAPVTLVARDGSKDLLWISGNPLNGSGIPPLKVIAKERAAVGLVVFYRRTGVLWSWAAEALRRVNIQGREWDVQQIEEYWRDIKTHVPSPLMNGAPFVCPILSDPTHLREYLSKNKHDRRGSIHDNARTAHQLLDADVDMWPKIRHFVHLPSNLTHIGRVFDFRYLWLPDPSVPDGRIWTAKHPHGYEVIVPLIGRFRCRGAKLYPTELSDPEVQEYLLSDLPPERIIRGEAVSARDLGRVLPNFAVVCSDEVFHGFAAAGGKDAYALHIRIADNLKLPARDPRATPQTGVADGGLPVRDSA